MPFADQGVYFQVTRGVAKRDHAFPARVAPTVFMMSNPLVLPTAEQVERGVAVITGTDQRWLHCDLKTISLLGNVLARQAAVEAGAVESVLFRDGYLTEASASNVLIVKNGTIIAPPKDNLILPGITYDATFELARAGGLPLTVRPVTRDEALGADEMWLSSSSKEVLAVTTVDGKPFAGGRARTGLSQDARAVPGQQAQADMTARLARLPDARGRGDSGRRARPAVPRSDARRHRLGR